VKIVNANWRAGPGGEHGRFEVMIVTDDDQQHVSAPGSEATTALIASTQADTLLAWDPARPHPDRRQPCRQDARTGRRRPRQPPRRSRAARDHSGRRCAVPAPCGSGAAAVLLHLAGLGSDGWAEASMEQIPAAG